MSYDPSPEELEYVRKPNVDERLAGIIARQLAPATAADGALSLPAGRHATGDTIPAEQVPAEAKPLPVCENPDAVIVPKRVALSVAAELLEDRNPQRIIGREDRGYCVIYAFFAGKKITSWHGRNWFLALHNLRTSLQ